MFNLRRILRFLGNLLIAIIPFLVAVFLLAFLTEILTQDGEPADLFFSGRFWFSVCLDALPAIVAMLAVLWLASRFVYSVYGLENRKQGIGFLLRSRFGLPGFGPWMKVEEGKIDEGRGEILRKTGGPGHLVVYNDSAVVLERGGQLTKIEGAGFPELDPFEKVYDVIDLRPKRYQYTVSAMTKEGIPINWDADIRYKIDDGGQPPTPKTPYPFSEKDVLRAATCQWRREPGFRHGQDMDWEGLIVVSQTEGTLRSILARRRLDQLIGLTEEDERAARESVQNELKQSLHDIVSEFGARILEVKLDNLKVTDDVTQQWIRAWQARWQRWSAGLLAQGEASYIYEYEVVKAEAQMQMLAQITQALHNQMAGQTVRPQAVSQMVLMRLFSVLDRAEFAASSRIFFPTQTLEALESIKKPLMLSAQASVARIKLSASATSILINRSTQLLAAVTDTWGKPVPDGTPVQFGTNNALGNVAPALTFTTGGQVTSILWAGNQHGPVTVTVQVGSISDQITINII